MNGTYGRTYVMPLAQYDPALSSWKTSEVTCLWALPMSLETLPPWGLLQGGELFELPTPAHLTTGQGFSSLPTPRADNSRGLPNGGDYQSLPNTVLRLPTPTAQAAKHMAMDDRGEGTHDDHNLWSVAGRLLPTPAVNDMGAGKDPQAWEAWTQRMKAEHGNSNGHGKSLEQEALKMLPTPVASDCNDRQASENWQGGDLVSTVKQLGDSTPQPLNGGKPSLDEAHLALPFDETTATA